MTTILTDKAMKEDDYDKKLAQGCIDHIRNAPVVKTYVAKPSGNPGELENEDLYNKICALAYHCIQWGDGEITGYDSERFEREIRKYNITSCAIKDERIRELEEALKHIIKMDSAWNMREAAERALNPAREALKK